MKKKAHTNTEGSFPLSKGKELGYKPAEVDAFLSEVRKAYENDSIHYPNIGCRQIRERSFPLVKNGYTVRFVDAALERLEEVFFEREKRRYIRDHGEDAWWQKMRETLSAVRARVNRSQGKRFKRKSILASGYKCAEVDAFLDTVSELLERRELTLAPAAVRGVVFHSQTRGYREEQVDALLDALLDLVLAVR